MGEESISLNRNASSALPSSVAATTDLPPLTTAMGIHFWQSLVKWHLDRGFTHPNWMAVSVVEVSITSPKTEQLLSTHNLAPLRHIAWVTGEITQVGKELYCLLSLGQVIYWVCRTGSKLNASSCHWLENAQLLREFRDTCTPMQNGCVLLTGVQGHTSSSVQPFCRVGPGSSAKQPQNGLFVLNMQTSINAIWGYTPK